MTSDPPELGKGMFGYRKSAVNQILADRDIMLRQAEGRVRAAESKVADLESELAGVKDRNSRMDEQLDRLRTQLDTLAGKIGMEAPAIVEQEDEGEQEPPAIPAREQDSPAAEAPTPTVGDPFGFGEPEAEFAGLDPIAPPSSSTDNADEDEDEDDMAYGVSIFESSADESIAPSTAEAAYEPPAYEPPAYEPAADPAAAHAAWLDPKAEAEAEPEPTMDMDLVYGSTDYSYQPEEQSEPIGTEAFSFPYEGDRFGDDLDELPPVMTFDAGDGTALDGTDLTASTPPAWDLPDEVRESAAAALAEAAAKAAEAAEASEAALVSEDDDVASDEEPIPLSEATEAPASAEAAAQPAAAPSVSPETIDLTNRFLTDEIQGILAAAEESANRIVERARSTTQHQIAQSNRLWREVQAEVSRFATWREQVEPVIRSVQSKVESVRVHIDEVPERIRQALAPMADSISNVDADLAELASASSPPLLLTPRGLDSGPDQVEDWLAGDLSGDFSGDLAEDLPEDPEASSEGDASGHMAG